MIYNSQLIIYNFILFIYLLFSAVCDLGWPDCFNSGVFVFKPSQSTFNELLQLAKTEDSFDGGEWKRAIFFWFKYNKLSEL